MYVRQPNSNSQFYHYDYATYDVFPA